MCILKVSEIIRQTKSPGSSCGFCVLLKGLTSVVVLKVEESAGYSLKSKFLDNWDCLSFGGIKKRSEFISL